MPSASLRHSPPMVATTRQHVGVELGQRDLVGDRVLTDVRRAQRVAVDVGADLAEDVVEVTDEPWRGWSPVS